MKELKRSLKLSRHQFKQRVIKLKKYNKPQMIIHQSVFSVIMSYKFPVIISKKIGQVQM